ncbi:sugar transferase [Streptomyces sp. NBC_01426]|uniref:sugar transferase n=1 Tax=Streptomyces sp. NBC_01426 TaxID=2975866 RepID=UPI002E30267E|nr:sugar transferase [Streptomyces sp. NBC_01426]
MRPQPPSPRPPRTFRLPTPSKANPSAPPGPRRPAFPRPDLSAKRVLDLVGAVILLGVFALPLLAAAGLLCAGRRGVLVREPALGRGGREFRTWRLRTRDTGRPGSVVERCGLDALPQLLNVLRGEMSLVGPRPEAGTDRPERLFVRPGMTGLWQVSARSDLPWEEMALLDRHYVESHWLGMDLAILAQTPRAACLQRHA